MTPAALRAALAGLRWSQTTLADALGCSPTLVYRWTSGAYPVPPEIAAWLARRAASEARDPPPQGWQRRTGRAA